MILHFFEPPPAQKIGGLEAAIRSLEQYLVSAGVTVRVNSAPDELGRGAQAEVVHFHGLWQRGFPTISARCRRLGIPYVVSPHGMLEPWAWRHKWWKKWPYFYARERGHLRRAQALHATGEAEAKQLQAFFPGLPCTVLPLGLLSSHGPDYANARQRLGWPEREIVLLYLSRLHPKKGLHLLLEALAKLGVSGPSSGVRLSVVGEGEGNYVAELKTYVERNQGSLPRVEWLGAVWGETRWAYFQAADLFCLPSHSENFGLAVLEALQVGTRVLTTTHTPWNLLPQWKAGWVVEPGANEILAALRDYLTARSWTDAQRGALAQKTHRFYAWETIGPSYLKFYESLVRKG